MAIRNITKPTLYFPHKYVNPFIFPTIQYIQVFLIGASPQGITNIWSFILHLYLCQICMILSNLCYSVYHVNVILALMYIALDKPPYIRANLLWELIIFFMFGGMYGIYQQLLYMIACRLIFCPVIWVFVNLQIKAAGSLLVWIVVTDHVDKYLFLFIFVYILIMYFCTF
mgnify:CR=1 FL=1